MPDRETEELEQAAVEQAPGGSAEQGAQRLTPKLQKYAEASEAKEADDLRSADAAPERASEGVAEHERDMVRRGFEKEGPPE